MTGESAMGTGKTSCCGREDTDKMGGDAGAGAMAGMSIDASVRPEGVDMPGDGAMSAGTEQPDGVMPEARMDIDSDARSTDSGMPGGDMDAPPTGGGMGGGNRDGGDGANGDDGEPLPQRRDCGTMDWHRTLLSISPAYAAARDSIENQTIAFEQRGGAMERAGITRIPVVVHVVWNTATQNVSDAQIQSQIAVLNRDFRRTNPDVAGTPAAFLPLATDARIEFFLATTDPNGNPTTGIVRRQTTVTSFGQNNAAKSNASGGSDAWPSQRYLNIWVCRLSGGLLGYAQFPGGPAATDGVVIRDTAFGTVGTAAAPFNLGRTTTHEIGHWLNLNHIWGDDGTGCNGTDNVDDTPNQAGANTGMPTFPKLSCGNGPTGDMFMNYMDYTDDRGMFMFSAGQVTRMQACLDGPRSQIGLGTGGGGSAATPRPSSSPVVAWGSNRLDVFVLGTDRALYHKAWDGSAWRPTTSGYEALGGVCTCAPQALAWGPNRLDIFVTGTDRALYHKWWDGSRWGPSATGYEYMGGTIVGTPRAVSWGANRLDVFVLGTDNALYHKWWDGSRWGPSLTGYEFMGGTIIGQPEIVSWGSGRLDVFVIGTDRALYHKWFDGSRWGPSLTGWESLGGVCTSAPRAVCWGPNRIDVFVTGTDSALYHKWWDGSRWGPSISGWERQGGACIGQPEAVAWGPNRLDVFVLGTDRAVYHKWWNGSAWGPSLTGFEAQGGVCTAGPRAVAWGTNRLDLFVRGTDNALYHKAWNGTAWTPSLTGYAGLGGTITSM